ncbi:MAG: S24/S26 family peptidase [Oscillospiraceae bacterium]|jgi:hypothetical protein|nr:S24/S26 family peptidase [Oscillospiraceae bacterium]MBQ5711454.1 S24/S26 family peptidase [Oscillospiraceae bacterium]
MSNTTFEEVLRTQGRLIHTNVGDSMLPLLRQGRDLMVIEPRPEGPCKRYDAVLYKRPNGKYVMHRILKKRSDGYVICGDNRWMREFGVPDEWIIGILTGVLRDGKDLVRVTDFKYRLYVHLWCDFYWIRAFILRVRGNLRKLKRKKK